MEEDLLVFAILGLSPAPATGDSFQIPIWFSLPVRCSCCSPACACLCKEKKRGACIRWTEGFQAQADWLFCFYGYLYASFLTRFLSVCRVCLESAFRSPIPKHMVGARQVACFPRLENGAEAYGLNPPHGTIVRGWQDRVRTEAVVLNAEVIYSLDLHRGKRRRG